MDRDELHFLKYNCLHGGKEAIEKAFQHIEDLQHIVGELAEGLECPELQKEVDRLLKREEPEITI
jgi:hypothetical protein